MCGIWGFEGKPDEYQLKGIITRADERGGHGYGFFGITANDQHIYHVSHGRVDVDLLVNLASRCIVGIGHSRLVTSGDMQIMNSQPVLGDGVAVVHNGNIKEYKMIMYSLGYQPRTNLDSEALIPMIKKNVAKIKGTYLAIEYTKYSYKFTGYQKQLPLIHHKFISTDYYCSKEWHQQS